MRRSSSSSPAASGRACPRTSTSRISSRTGSSASSARSSASIPDREIKFETFAMARIRGAIIDELRSLDWVPRSVRTRARQIERAIAALEKELIARRPTRRSRRSSASRATSSRRACTRSRARRSPRSTSCWSPSGGGDQIALIDTIEDESGPDPEFSLEQTEVKEALAEAISELPGAREARRHALLLRGADAARDRRGARRHRVARLAAAHEGDPAPEGAPLGRDPRAGRDLASVRARKRDSCTPSLRTPRRD